MVSAPIGGYCLYIYWVYVVVGVDAFIALALPPALVIVLPLLCLAAGSRGQWVPLKKIIICFVFSLCVNV